MGKTLKKQIKVTVEGKDALPWEKLEPFQGALKHLEKPEYEALRKTLIEMGFSFVVHVWKNKGHNYIIDGHQRMFAVKQMVETEGWEISHIPVVYVEAKNFKEARLKVLASASQYGKMTKDSLAKFAIENDINLEDLIGNFHFPEVDLGDLSSFFDVPTEGAIPDTTDTSSEAGRSLKSGSDQVKQLQLFFSLKEHDEFIAKLEELKVKWKKENISDTLLELVREAHKTLQKK